MVRPLPKLYLFAKSQPFPDDKNLKIILFFHNHREHILNFISMLIIKIEYEKYIEFFLKYFCVYNLFSAF